MNSWRHVDPYSTQFLLVVKDEHAGQSLIDFYCGKFGYKPREFWTDLIAKGNSNVNHQTQGPDYILEVGDEIRTRRDDVQEPDVRCDYKVLLDEDGIFVVNKPAPLPAHPSGRYFKNSLLSILKEDYPDRKFHTIHRLDKWTTGVLVLATDPDAARCLHKQVEAQAMKKSYGVLAAGHFPKQRFQIDAAIGRVKGAHRGTGKGIEEAKESLTEFEIIKSTKPIVIPDLIRDPGRDDTVEIDARQIHLLKATPVTGRTNQIRVHVQAAGGHVLNDPLYSPLQKAEHELIPYLGLHCRSMGFKDVGGKDITIHADWPEHFLEFFPEIEF